MPNLPSPLPPMSGEILRINFYIGPVLSQTGALELGSTQIRFRPLGVVERALGAEDVTIPLSQIVAFDILGGLSRMIRIKTKHNLFKFEGAEAGRFGDWLVKKIPDKLYHRPTSVKLLHPIIGPKYSCPECTEVL